MDKIKEFLFGFIAGGHLLQLTYMEPEKRKKDPEEEEEAGESESSKRPRPLIDYYEPHPVWAADVKLECYDRTGALIHVYACHSDTLRVVAGFGGSRPKVRLEDQDEIGDFDLFLRFLYEKDLSRLKKGSIWNTVRILETQSNKWDAPTAQHYVLSYFRAHWDQYASELYGCLACERRAAIPILSTLALEALKRGEPFMQIMEVLFESVSALDPSDESFVSEPNEHKMLYMSSVLYKQLLFDCDSG